MDERNYWTSRRLGRRRLIATSAATAAGVGALAVAGCGDDDDDTGGPVTAPTTDVAQTAKKGGTLRTAVNNFPVTMDPLLSGASAIRANANSRLFTNKVGPGVPYISTRMDPDIPESYEQPDNLTLILKLRPNIKFGAPVNRLLNADDVVYSFDRYVGKIPGVTKSSEAGDTERIFASWTATDPRTVRLVQKAPQAALTYRLGGTPLRPT